MRGFLAKQDGPVTYQVDVNGELWKRHVDQLLECRCPATSLGTPGEEDSTADAVLSGTGLENTRETKTPSPEPSPEPTHDIPEAPEPKQVVPPPVLPPVTASSPCRTYPQCTRNPQDRFEPTFQ